MALFFACILDSKGRCITVQDLLKETIQANQKAMEISKDSIIHTNKINRRLVIIIIALIGVIVLQNLFYSIRDVNIAKSYFKSVIQESTKEELKQEFKQTLRQR